VITSWHSHVIAPGRELKFEVSDDTLFGKLTGYGFVSVFEKSKDLFAVDGVDASVDFERDADERIAAANLRIAGTVEHGVPSKPEIERH